MGDRLNHVISVARYRAASALLLLAPESPLLFQGQEWAASSPFAYFTDHAPDLGRLVTEGRRKEFAHFAGFADAGQRERIPDPQAAGTFDASRLKWAELVAPPHSDVLRLYSALLHIRATHPACRASDRALFDCVALAPHTVALVRRAPPALQPPATLLVIVHLSDEAARVPLTDVHSALMPATGVRGVAYHTDGAEWEAAAKAATFRGAGAILLDL